jgi:poly(A) polymerase
VFKLAALLHDIAKPDKRSVGADGRVHFYEHEEAGSGMAAARAHALRLSSDEVEQVRVMVRHHMRPNQMTRDISAMPTARAVYRYVAIAGQCAPELALFCVADGMGKGGPATLLADAQRRAAIAAMLIARYYDQFSPVVAPQPLLSGRDVIALGVAPGPQIGRILSEVREAQMVGEIITRRDALQLAQSLVKNNN